MKHSSHENDANDHQLQRLLIVKQILHFGTRGNGKNTVWRIYTLKLGYKG